MDSNASAEGGANWSSCISVGGLASLGVAGLLWFLSKAEGERADRLRDIASHERLDELLQFRARLPFLVAVRGRVYSAAPKKCELSDKLAVVHEVIEEEIWRRTRENGRVVNEPFEVKRSSERSEWFLEDGMSSTRIKVENVVDADRLGSVLQTTQVFVPEDSSKVSLARMILDKSWQMAKVGMRKTERCLPVGSVVTVIGQLDESVLARDPTHAAALGLGGENGAGAPSSSASSGQGTAAEPSAPPLPPGMPFFNPFGSSRAPLPPAVPAAGTSHPPAGSSALTVGAGGAPIPYLLLRKPAGGGPFIITPLTLQQLYESMSRVSRVYQGAAIGIAAFGTLLVARKLFGCVARYWREARAKRRLAHIQEQRKREMARRAAAALAAGGGEAAAAAASGSGAAMPTAASGAVSAPGEGDGGDHYEEERMAGTCVVCIDRQVEVVFTSCGHMCCCERCGSKLNRCPVCRLRGTPIKVYRP